MNKIEEIMQRISIAETICPMSVFKNHRGLFVVPTRTVQTAYWLKMGNPQHIGTFDNTFNPVSVGRVLREAESMVQWINEG